MIKSALLLNEINDVQYALKKYHFEISENKLILISFRPAVVEYLNTKNYNCTDLNSLLRRNDQKINFQNIKEKFLNLLSLLDKKFRNPLNLENAISELRCFFYLYRIEGLFDLNGLIISNLALKKFLLKNKIRELTFCGSEIKGHGILKTSDYIKSFSNTASKLKVRTIVDTINTSSLKAGTSVFLSLLKKLSYLPHLLAKYIPETNIAYLKNKPITIIFKPFYEAKYLINKQLNIAVWPANSNLPFFKKVTYQGGKHITSYKNEKKQKNYFDIILNACADHFFKNAHRHKYNIAMFQKFLLQNKVTGGIWGLPPASSCGSNSLLVELLRIYKLPVFGIQHGGPYDQKNLEQIHDLTDYSVCDFFLKYGDDKSSQKHWSKNFRKKCKSIVVGSIRESERIKTDFEINNKSEMIDVLFPINILHDTFLGIPNLPNNLMFFQQKKICDLLNASGLKVVIKPHLGSTLNKKYLEIKYPIIQYLKNLQHLKVDDTLLFEDSMRKYKPRLVIFEMPSTPLFECLSYNCDIIHLSQCVFSWKKWAKTLISKRIYLPEKLNEFENLFLKFQMGNLKKKRNAEFYRSQFYSSKHSLSNAVKFIEKHSL